MLVIHSFKLKNVHWSSTYVPDIIGHMAIYKKRKSLLACTLPYAGRYRIQISIQCSKIINKLYICTYIIHVYTCVICTIYYVKLCRDIYVYII